MAPQPSIPPVATVLGTIGTLCWCVQLLPQIYRNWRTKSTEGLPANMMLLWSMSGVPFGIYAIVQNFNLGIQIQPQCFLLFCLISWGQCMVYSSKWRARTTILVCTTILVVDAALEVVLILVIRKAYARGTSWPVTLMGILAFILLVSGYVPIPFELVKRRGRVVGIDFLFLTIDWLGAFFSLISLVVQDTFDILFGTLYALCACIEMSMFISHGIWWLRTRRLRKRAAEAGIPFDQYPEAMSWQSSGLKFPTIRIKSKPAEDASAMSCQSIPMGPVSR